MSPIRRLLLPLVLILVSFLTSLFVLSTPVPAFQTEDPETFSAVNCAEYIGNLSLDPHSVYDPLAHEAVRQYLIDTLSGFVGAGNVQTFDYSEAEIAAANPDDNPDRVTAIRNVLASIPGESEMGILLVAHYDSRGHIGRSGELGRSYGAADDGYGIATLLEIARMFGGASHANSIYLLFTDGEETGLYGAQMASLDQAFLAKVGFVINVEARGIRGAAYMFETSTDNAKVIDFYRNADRPVSYSLATAVYTVMPNMTDFTEFLAAGKPGVNFAVLDGLKYYHSPLDNFTNIDLNSLQHYGAQIAPLVAEFAANPEYATPDYFVGTQDSIFFTLLPGVLVSYSETFGTVMNLVLLVLFVLLVAWLAFRKEAKVLGILKHFGFLLLAILVFAVVGVFASQLIAAIAGVPWSLTYVRMDGSESPTAALLVLVLAFLAFLVFRKVKPTERKELMLAGIFLNLLLSTLTGFVLSGASFLFFVPAFFGLISLLVITFVRNRIASHVFLSQNIIWNVLLLVPILFSLFLAVTVGALAALLAILIINASVVLPSVALQADL